MSLPYVPDIGGVVLEFTMDSFTEKIYYEDPECTIYSGKLRGKYQKTIKGKLHISPYTKYQWLSLFESVEYGTLNPQEDIDPSVCDNFIRIGEATIVYEKIEENPDYNPERWQELYDESVKASIIDEREGYNTF